MQFLQLDLDVRYKIYTQTKKTLRKYQKGIISGKLTPEKFVDNMLKDTLIEDILKSINVSSDSFKDTYRDYVETLISIQNENLLSNKRKFQKNYSKKVDYTSIFKLNELLNDNGYDLSIPSKYLTQSDIDSIVKFITTGNIDLGDEKIYNYVNKKI
ncbi:hypothetical protein [Peptostreptococcus faecalis]|uniref:hypothetical protein n=1 Tax=Peptostreptococcus faecalis TaxID=2045015 RepID=UPI000C7988F1|nr:hypothetical protein [Peptostreptococcus faecalis]